MPLDYRQVLRDNVRALLRHHGQEAKTLKAYYMDGKKKGQRVSARLIQYMLQDGPEVPSPALDAIAAVAHALKVLPWQMLVSGLDPGNPPHLVLTPDERKLYAEFQRLRAQIAQTQAAS